MSDIEEDDWRWEDDEYDNDDDVNDEREMRGWR